MKKTTTLYIISLLFISYSYSQESKQSKKPTIMQQETPYHQLEISAIDKVILEKGTTQKIEITKGQEYQDLLEINVVNNKLIINKKPSKNKQIHLKITYTNLNQLKILNLGSVSCTNAITNTNLLVELQNTADANLNIVCDNLKLICSTTSDLILIGQLKTSELEVKNTANLDFTKLFVEQMNLVAKNGANGKIIISGKLSLVIENYASFTVKGSPTIIKKEIKNVADFKM